MAKPKINIEKMSSAELQDLVKAIDKELETRKKAEVKAVLAGLKKKAAELGMTVEQMLGQSKKTKGVAKYQNPDNLEQTWTGRGARPAWVKAWIAKGKPMEGLAIK